MQNGSWSFPNMHILTKQMSPWLPRNLAPRTFVISVKSAVPLLFHDPEVLPSASDKAKLFAKNFSKNFNLDYSGISLPIFPSATDLNLHNTSVTPKMVKKAIRSLGM